MIRVAVISAGENTSLEAHCLYDGEATDLTIWLAYRGVKIHRTRVPFREELFSEATRNAAGSLYFPDHACGAFLRLIAHRYANPGTFLYTDCDVMFMDDRVASLRTNRIAAAAEITSGFNSGVMLIDRDYMAEREVALRQFIADRGYYYPRLGSYDQHFLNCFFVDLWDEIDPHFNWRPGQGRNDDASIIHFHGPKPHRIDAILNGQALPEEAGLAAMIEAGRGGYAYHLDLFHAFLKRESAIEGLGLRQHERMRDAARVAKDNGLTPINQAT